MRSAAAAIAPGVQALTPREAYFAAARPVPWADAAGTVAAEAVVPYSPNIPVLTPGEIVSLAEIDYLRALRAERLHVRGPADPALRTLRVIAG